MARTRSFASAMASDFVPLVWLTPTASKCLPLSSWVNIRLSQQRQASFWRSPTCVRMFELYASTVFALHFTARSCETSRQSNEIRLFKLAISAELSQPLAPELRQLSDTTHNKSSTGHLRLRFISSWLLSCLADFPLLSRMQFLVKAVKYELIRVCACGSAL